MKLPTPADHGTKYRQQFLEATRAGVPLSKAQRRRFFKNCVGVLLLYGLTLGCLYLYAIASV